MIFFGGVYDVCVSFRGVYLFMFDRDFFFLFFLGSLGPDE